MLKLNLSVAFCFSILAPALSPAQAAETEQDVGVESYCAALPQPFDQAAKRTQLETRYPQGQESVLGEGVVRLGFTVNPTGNVQDIWLMDIIGAPIFAHAGAGSLAKAKHSSAVLAGKPVEFHSEADFQFLISGKNRAGTHALVGTNYDRAQAQRTYGDYQGSVATLKENLKLTLNMYEYALTSYGLTVSYIALNDRRRALLHARHTAVSDAQFADKGQRRSTFAMLSELEARDNNFRASLCAFERLKKQYPDYQPSAQLQELLALSARELGATTPIRSEVELVESGREDLPTMWRHTLARRSFRFSDTQGNLTSYRLVCPAARSEEKFPISRTIDVDPSVGHCSIYVFGNAGAKFTLEER